MNQTAINLCDEKMLLLPERALYWERTRTLMAADLHLGKAAAFRAAALPVPDAVTADTLSRLTELLVRLNPIRLVVLGDFLHSKSGCTQETLQAISVWRARHTDVEMLLVRGNHDKPCDPWLIDLDIELVDEPYAMPPFALRHIPADIPGAYTLAGHVHPAVNLVGPAKDRMRLPCFVFGENVGMLPSFGSFTGSYVIQPSNVDRVYVVADQVLAVT